MTLKQKYSYLIEVLESIRSGSKRAGDQIEDPRYEMHRAQELAAMALVRVTGILDLAWVKEDEDEPIA